MDWFASKSFKKNLLPFTLLTITVVGYCIKYFLNTLLASHMNPSSYGDFSIALRTLSITAAIALLGTDISSKRFLSTYVKNKNTNKIYNYVGWNLRLIKRTFTITLLVALFAVAGMHVLHLYKIKYIHEYHLAVYMLWVTPFVSMTMLLSSFLLCTNSPVLSIFINNMAKYLLMVLSFITAIFFAEIPLNTINITSVLFIAFVFLIVIECFFMRGRQMFTLETFKHFKHIKTTDKKWLQTSVKLIVNNIAFLILCTLDLILVEIIIPNEHLVGFYAASLTIAGFIWLAPQSIYATIKPQINHLLNSHAGKIKLQKILDRTNCITFIVAGAMTSCIIVFSKFLLTAFGSAYVHAEPALIVLTLSYMIGIFSKSPALVLAYGGGENCLLWITLFELAIAITAITVFTYFFGIIGAAVGTSLSITFKTVTMLITIKRKFGIKPIIIF